jgi:MFS family permease
MHTTAPRGTPLPDSSVAWAMLGLSCLALFAALGIRMSFGAYVTAWETAFGADRSQVSLVASVSLIVYGLGLPLAGRLADRRGARSVLTGSLLFIGAGLIGCSAARSVWSLLWCYGIVSSIGFCGTSSVTLSVAVMRWFRYRRGLALGVTSCGIAAGQMILVPLAIFLIGRLGWRQTLLLFGIASSTLLPGLIWLFFRDAPSEQGEGREEAASRAGTVPRKSAQPPARRAQRVAFPRWQWLPWFIVVPYFICGFTDLGLISTHFIPLAEGKGFSSEIIALAIGIDALANVGGNLLTGYLSDKVRLTLLLAVMYVVRAFGLIVLFFAQDPTLLITFAIINGSVEASTIAPTAALCGRVYGPGRMGTVFGLVSSAHQFGAAAGAFLIGVLFTRTGSYGQAVLGCVGLLLVAAMLSWLLQALLSRREKIEAFAVHAQGRAAGGCGPTPKRSWPTIGDPTRTGLVPQNNDH